MESSEYFDEEEEFDEEKVDIEWWIDTWVLLCDPEGMEGLPLPAEDMHEGYPILSGRTDIHNAGFDTDERVKKADRMLLEHVLQHGARRVYAPYDESFEETYPLEQWWWYLEEIAKGTYPAELLPEHLRDLYVRRPKNRF